MASASSGPRGQALGGSRRSVGLNFASGQSAVGSLASFFPAGTPLRFAVEVSNVAGDLEQTVIEYGTAREVLFVSALPLEFGEQVRLSRLDGGLDVDALVVALRLQNGQLAVAARFSQEISNWIVKP